MEKRFRSTDLTNKPWYRKLAPVFKCVFTYLLDTCDKAGIWTVDVDAMEFFIGAPVDFNAFMEAINADRDQNDLRIEWYPGNKKVWITGFTHFQYGELSSASKPHEKIIALLNSYGLLHRVPVRVQDSVFDRVPGTLQERKGKEEEGKGQERDKEGEEKTPELFEKQKPTRKPNFLPGKDDSIELKREYDAKIVAERDKIDSTAMKLKIADFIQSKKPAFIEPYADLWNLSAFSTGLQTISERGLTESRKQKLKVRLKEPAFDFIKILEEIKKSGYLRGQNERSWKVDFDWVIENDKHYIKIIEGSYNYR